MSTTKASGAQQFLPEDRGLDSLAAAASRCRGCPLYENASQTVFGYGHSDAPIMLVGEQPGDREDIEGLSPCWARHFGSRPIVVKSWSCLRNQRCK
jgi:hypothetical protein